MDGLVGIAHGDEARVRRAERDLAADSLPAARHAARSLTGLWLSRADAERAADTLKAISDAAMREGGFLLSVEAVNRLTVARALRRRGMAAQAEKYLMWMDAGVNTARNVGISQGLWTLVAYERGTAHDEAGNREAAKRYLRAFLDDYDRPMPALASTVDDARQRLARLERGDAPPTPKSVGRPR
jgi:hypothetical protein